MNKAIQWIHHRKRKYYAVLVCRDLLGDWVLIREREWGSLDSKRGGQKTELLGSEDEAVSKLKDISKRRLAHGYSRVGDPIK